ncbi:MAG: diguanylate cyclase [Planctomycetes bacterium]|nr:diguanylate cyclase [Planctomycetota bacterium]
MKSKPPVRKSNNTAKGKGSRSKPAAGRAKIADAAQQGAPVVVVTSNSTFARAIERVVHDVAVLKDPRGIDSAVATGARVAFVDSELPEGANCYEFLRRLRVRTSLRIALCHPNAKKLDASIHALARFAGAETVLSSPPSPAELKSFMKPPASGLIDPILGASGQDAARSASTERRASFEKRILHDISNPHDPALLDAICDPETRLYSSVYGAFAYDLEVKRAQRFAFPLSIAIVGFDGEASTEVLLEIAGIFLNEIRDTDTLARFSINSFFFVLPNTLADGACAMLERIAKSVAKRKLRDLVGDLIQLNSGVAGLAIPSNETRDVLFQRAFRAFEKARVELRPAVSG